MDESTQSVPTPENASGSQGNSGSEEQQGDPQDIEKNKGIAIVAYFIFFVPLLAAKDSRFAMYHANQGLLLFLMALAVNVLGTIIPFIGWFLILPFGMLFVIVLWVMGIINASQGKMKPLPVIGGISILN